MSGGGRGRGALVPRLVHAQRSTSRQCVVPAPDIDVGQAQDVTEERTIRLRIRAIDDGVGSLDHWDTSRSSALACRLTHHGGHACLARAVYGTAEAPWENAPDNSAAPQAPHVRLTSAVSGLLLAFCLREASDRPTGPRLTGLILFPRRIHLSARKAGSLKARAAGPSCDGVRVRTCRAVQRSGSRPATGSATRIILE